MKARDFKGYKILDENRNPSDELDFRFCRPNDARSKPPLQFYFMIVDAKRKLLHLGL